MTEKWKAMIKLIGLSLGLIKTANQPFRIKLIYDLFCDRTVKKSDEIIVTPIHVQVRTGLHQETLLASFSPFSDDEREALCAVLRARLPLSFHQEKHYDPDLSLTAQARIHFIKTAA